jgi:hypothetical protein
LRYATHASSRPDASASQKDSASLNDKENS